MKKTLTISFNFLLISIAIAFVLGCPTKKTSLSQNDLIDCSVTVNGKNYNVTIDSAATTGRLSLPHGSDLSTLKVATIEVSNKAKASLSEGSSITVSNNTFTIAVTAENGNVNNYTIVIIVGPNNKAEIKTFTFQKDINPQLNEDVVATITNNTVKAFFPYGTDLHLIPTFTLSDKATAKANNTNQINGTSSQDFSSDIKYVITSQDGKTKKTYAVTLNTAPPNNKAEITAFTFKKDNNPKLLIENLLTTIANDTVKVGVPYGNKPHLTLAPTFTLSTGATAKVQNTKQFSDTSIQDFSSAVNYVVTAQDGKTTKTYVVMVLNNETYLKAFQFKKNNNPRLSQDLMIDFTAKPTQADMDYIGLATFLPTFSLPFGAKVYVNDVEQISGVTSQDFLNTVTYKVVAQSGVTQNYKIAINYKSTNFTITSNGAISGNNTALSTAIIGEYMNGIRVTEIDKDGFFRYPLTKLRLPNSLDSIGDRAFSYCDKLTGDLTIPNSVTFIGGSAFVKCEKLTGDLTIPNSVTFIGNGAFVNCKGFNGTLTLSSSLEYIGEFAFANCHGFTGDLTIPNSVTFIGIQAFWFCDGFNGTLTLSNSITSIEKSTFEDCEKFTGDLIIPSSVTKIGDKAFANCKGFNGDLTIPNSVTSIGELAFLSCSGFTGDLIIPSSVTVLRNYVFNNCGFDGKLIIHNSVTSIGAYAFDGCTKFKARCNQSNATLGAKAFEGVTTDTDGCP